jgi:hypothetical protein
MEKTTTGRGFDIIKFTDRYGHECSLQKSSLATEDAIWFGPNEAEPQIMASQSNAVKTKQMVLMPTLNKEDKSEGWIPYPIPNEVELYTRMHLTQDQVKELLPFLIKFAETGDL